MPPQKCSGFSLETIISIYYIIDCNIIKCYIYIGGNICKQDIIGIDVRSVEKRCCISDLIQ
nr:MAG TPA: hypothetical protein [Caudoviricetes sp.]